MGLCIMVGRSRIYLLHNATHHILTCKGITVPRTPHRTITNPAIHRPIQSVPLQVAGLCRPNFELLASTLRSALGNHSGSKKGGGGQTRERGRFKVSDPLADAAMAKRKEGCHTATTPVVRLP